MSSVWPGTLPQYVNQDAFREQRVDNTIRTQSDGGSVKLRRRFTAVPVKYTISLTLTAAQKATLDGFYVTTLKDGSLPFEWVLPAEQTTKDFIFMASPQYTAVGPSTYMVQLELQTVI